MKKPKISGTETSKWNLPCSAPNFFSDSDRKFNRLSFAPCLHTPLRCLFFYWHLCVGGRKRQFLRKIMKYDSYLIWFLHMNVNMSYDLYFLIFADRKTGKFGALQRIWPFFEKNGFLAKKMKFDTQIFFKFPFFYIQKQDHCIAYILSLNKIQK